MSDQKHFKYEAHKPLFSSQNSGEVEVNDVRFLTPAKISFKVEGVQKEEIVGIDLISRKVYRDDKELPWGEKVFEYLDAINSLPENFFEASEDIYQKASDAKAEHAAMQELGEQYGKA